MAKQSVTPETKKNVSTAAKNKKPNFFVRTGKKFKEVFSELKKVTWPTFGKVVKATGVVLVVVLIFTVAVTAVDAGLNALLTFISDLG